MNVQRLRMRKRTGRRRYAAAPSARQPTTVEPRWCMCSPGGAGSLKNCLANSSLARSTSPCTQSSARAAATLARPPRTWGDVRAAPCPVPPPAAAVDEGRRLWPYKHRPMRIWNQGHSGLTLCVRTAQWVAAIVEQWQSSSQCPHGNLLFAGLQATRSKVRWHRDRVVHRASGRGTGTHSPSLRSLTASEKCRRWVSGVGGCSEEVSAAQRRRRGGGSGSAAA